VTWSRCGRWWRFAYRFAQKGKTLALGTYPDVPLERARARHEFARDPLAHGIDPSALKKTLGKHAFIAAVREWEISQARTSNPEAHCAPDRQEQPLGSGKILSTG
jgi:hypothetical protein